MILTWNLDQQLNLTREIQQRQKRKNDDDIMTANCDAIVFFPIMANLQPSRSKIPDLWCLKLTFSLTKTFYFTKTENRAKKSLTQLSCYCFKVVLQPKMLIFCKKNVDISKIKEVLVLKGIFSKTTYIL